MLHNYLIDIVSIMLNVTAPQNKILCAIINVLNKITSTSSIHFAETLFWILKFLETRNYPLQFITKTKEADKCKKQIRQSRLKPKLFTDLVQKNESITILSHSAENFVGYPLLFSKNCRNYFLGFWRGQSLRILGGQ